MALYKYQDYIIDGQGRPVTNCFVAVLQQPGLGQSANISTYPGSPLANIFLNESGTITLSNPLTSGNGIDGLGNFGFYVANGYYTLQFYGGSINQPLTQVDMPIGVMPITYGNVTVSGNIDGVNTVFTLSATPATPSALLLTLSGAVLIQGNDYILNGNTINMAYAPTTGGSGFTAYFTT